MDRVSSALEIIRSQRDSLAASYHDLQVEHIMLKESLTLTSKLLETAKARISELEDPVNAEGNLASHAATDASA